MPMFAVSPSPLTPMPSSRRLASSAPGAPAGVLLEQPMPLILIVSYGLTPTALHASISALVMLLWPHPLHRVDCEPWNASVGREIVRPSVSTVMVASAGIA